MLSQSLNGCLNAYLIRISTRMQKCRIIDRKIISLYYQFRCNVSSEKKPFRSRRTISQFLQREKSLWIEATKAKYNKRSALHVQIMEQVKAPHTQSHTAMTNGLTLSFTRVKNHLRKSRRKREYIRIVCMNSIFTMILYTCFSKPLVLYRKTLDT